MRKQEDSNIIEVADHSDLGYIKNGEDPQEDYSDRTDLNSNTEPSRDTMSIACIATHLSDYEYCVDSDL